MTADEFRALKPGDKVTLLRYGVASAWGTIREIKIIERGRGLSLAWFDWIGMGPACMREWQSISERGLSETLALGHIRPPVVFDDEPQWFKGIPDRPGQYVLIRPIKSYPDHCLRFTAECLVSSRVAEIVGDAWLYGPIPEPPKEDA